MTDPADLARTVRDRLLARRRTAQQATPNWRLTGYRSGTARITSGGAERMLVADVYTNRDDAALVYGARPETVLAEVEKALELVDLMERATRSRYAGRAELAVEALELLAVEA